MSYLYNTPEQQREMLAKIGVDSIAELFEQIPADLRLNRRLALPPALTEIELEAHLTELAAKNGEGRSRVSFLGGGAYDHFIPAAVDAIASRSEFYTAYTPYQAEASQGSLQTFFEYQTLICQLAGMDVSNASLYEGGTAVSEAVFMAMRITNRHGKVVMLESVHPEYRQVCQTYLKQLNCELVVVPCPGGAADPDEVRRALDDRTACLVVQHPNFFGCLEEARELAELAHRVEALAVVSFDPVSLGLLARPGEYGADIAVAEGQALGIPLQYGGPYLGIMACKNDFARKMPGRLIGETVDRQGRRCFVLTLQAREQHIRREKATSNICTNQGLLALRATVHLSLLGKSGLAEVAELCTRKAHYAADCLTRLAQFAGLELAFPARPFFKEFTLRCRAGVDETVSRARAAGFDIGPKLSAYGKIGGQRLDDCLLVAVTEKRTVAEILGLAGALRR
ncbi:MAG TPA: aminomethyl-transferring glycine dehydrogenase subunit GcvPA [Planctomycetaceae bacterium]|nr:aminomethyl-transferring glycine dehydrogenase subunit GcvPA [Planctomycetaceae bacterium]